MSSAPAAPRTPRQPLRAAGTWNQPQRDLRKTELRIRRRDPIVTRKRQLDAAAERHCPAEPRRIGLFDLRWHANTACNVGSAIGPSNS